MLEKEIKVKIKPDWHFFRSHLPSVTFSPRKSIFFMKMVTSTNDASFWYGILCYTWKFFWLFFPVLPFSLYLNSYQLFPFGCGISWSMADENWFAFWDCVVEGSCLFVWRKWRRKKHLEFLIITLHILCGFSFSVKMLKSFLFNNEVLVKYFYRF